MIKKYCIVLFFVCLFIAGCAPKPVNTQTREPIVPVISNRDLESSLLKENEVFIMENSKGGVSVLDGNLMVIKEFDNAFLGKTIGVIEKDIPFILMKPKMQTGETVSDFNVYGIYLLSEDRWIVEPSYAGISVVGSNYYSALDSEFQHYVLNQEGLILAKGRVQEIGGNYWISHMDSEKTEIYNSNNEVINVINKRFDDMYNQGIAMIVYHNGEEEFYDKDGTLIMDESIIIKENLELNLEMQSLELFNINKSGELVYGSINSTTNFIADKEGKIIRQTAQNEELLFNEEASDFGIRNSITNDSLFYNINGDLMVSADGIPFSDYAGQSYYAYKNESGIYIEDIDTKESYRLNMQRSNQIENWNVRTFGKYIFSIFYDNAYDLYYKDILLKESNNGYLTVMGSYLIVNNTSSDDYRDVRSTIWSIDKNMELLYESKCSEGIIYVGESFVIAERGNYICILDLKGDYLYKTLNPDMGED